MSPILDGSKCEDAYGGYTSGYRHDTMICAGTLEAQEGSCKGDGGGPLICGPLSRGVYPELHGIVSWGHHKCGTEDKPEVFTRVCAFNEWIEMTIASNKNISQFS